MGTEPHDSAEGATRRDAADISRTQRQLQVDQQRSETDRPGYNPDTSIRASAAPLTTRVPPSGPRATREFSHWNNRRFQNAFNSRSVYSSPHPPSGSGSPRTSTHHDFRSHPNTAAASGIDSFPGNQKSAYTFSVRGITDPSPNPPSKPRQQPSLPTKSPMTVSYKAAPGHETAYRSVAVGSVSIFGNRTSVDDQLGTQVVGFESNARKGKNMVERTDIVAQVLQSTKQTRDKENRPRRQSNASSNPDVSSTTNVSSSIVVPQNTIAQSTAPEIDGVTLTSSLSSHSLKDVSNASPSIEDTRMQAVDSSRDNFLAPSRQYQLVQDALIKLRLETLPRTMYSAAQLDSQRRSIARKFQLPSVFMPIYEAALKTAQILYPQETCTNELNQEWCRNRDQWLGEAHDYMGAFKEVLAAFPDSREILTAVHHAASESIDISTIWEDTEVSSSGPDGSTPSLATNIGLDVFQTVHIKREEDFSAEDQEQMGVLTSCLEKVSPTYSLDLSLVDRFLTHLPDTLSTRNELKIPTQKLVTLYRSLITAMHGHTEASEGGRNWLLKIEADSIFILVLRKARTIHPTVLEEHGTDNLFLKSLKDFENSNYGHFLKIMSAFPGSMEIIKAFQTAVEAQRLRILNSREIRDNQSPAALSSTPKTSEESPGEDMRVVASHVDSAKNAEIFDMAKRLEKVERERDEARNSLTTANRAAGNDKRRITHLESREKQLQSDLNDATDKLKALDDTLQLEKTARQGGSAKLQLSNDELICQFTGEILKLGQSFLSSSINDESVSSAGDISRGTKRNLEEIGDRSNLTLGQTASRQDDSQGQDAKRIKINHQNLAKGIAREKELAAKAKRSQVPDKEGIGRESEESSNNNELSAAKN